MCPSSWTPSAIYNAKVSKLAEIDMRWHRARSRYSSPSRCRRAFRTCGPAGAGERHPYALVNPVIDQDGKYVAMGPIGKIEPPQLQPVTATLLQIAAGDLQAETDDGSDEVKANTSAEAMDIAATRIDAKSAIYLDNMKQSVQREGEIYLGMALSAISRMAASSRP
jgi:hypothetical protein